MIRLDSFGRTVAFGAVAALCWVPWVIVAEPLIGAGPSRSIYLTGTLTLYLVGLCPPASRLLAFASVMIGASALTVLAHTVTELVFLLCVVLGVARSVFLYPTAAVRAVVAEAVLLSAGLVFARFVGVIAIAPMSGAIWAFFLIQGFFFLAAPTVSSGVGRADPFDEAYRAAARLLEEREV